MRNFTAQNKVEKERGRQKGRCWAGSGCCVCFTVDLQNFRSSPLIRMVFPFVFALFPFSLFSHCESDGKPNWVDLARGGVPMVLRMFSCTESNITAHLMPNQSRVILLRLGKNSFCHNSRFVWAVSEYREGQITFWVICIPRGEYV